MTGAASAHEENGKNGKKDGNDGKSGKNGGKNDDGRGDDHQGKHEGQRKYSDGPNPVTHPHRFAEYVVRQALGGFEK